MAKLASVLIVDDNPRCLEFMTLAFAAQGSVSVSSEMKPSDAVDRIRNDKPDLVMLDVKMPEIDGFTVLSMLRRVGAAERRRSRLRRRMQWLSGEADHAGRLSRDGRDHR
jgi:CheY-like chemotaxis protein